MLSWYLTVFYVWIVTFCQVMDKDSCSCADARLREWLRERGRSLAGMLTGLSNDYPINPTLWTRPRNIYIQGTQINSSFSWSAKVESFQSSSQSQVARGKEVSARHVCCWTREAGQAVLEEFTLLNCSTLRKMEAELPSATCMHSCVSLSEVG